MRCCVRWRPNERKCCVINMLPVQTAEILSKLKIFFVFAFVTKLQKSHPYAAHIGKNSKVTRVLLKKYRTTCSLHCKPNSVEYWPACRPKQQCNWQCHRWISIISLNDLLPAPIYLKDTIKDRNLRWNQVSDENLKFNSIYDLLLLSTIQ